MQDFEFTVIVPVYNEADNLERLKNELSGFLAVSIKRSRVLFIDDGSDDGSREKIRDICAGSSGIFSYCFFDRNYGLSAALKAGFELCDTEWAGYIDADLQTSPLEFNKLLEHAGDYEMITGIRTNRKDSFIKNMSSVIANSIRKAFTHDGMIDTGCPLKVIRTDIAKRIPMFNRLHRFLPAMVLLQKGKILQVPVQHFPRIAGKSKYTLWNRLLGPLMDCFAYLWMKRKYINYIVVEHK